ncbi:MAG: flagellar protein FliS [Lachnospiraceae bacterium]|nr:flagellar protein FliS [Lachnospiraceae bacterium]
MTAEMKQEYTRKITQANRTGVVVLTYEIALDYIADAKKAASKEGFLDSVRHAKRCVEQLRDVLDFNYSLSFVLMQLYNYVTIEMDKASFRNDPGRLSQCEEILSELHKSFSEVALKDNSAPLMENTQPVYSGLTYGPGGANDSVGNANRGFTV